MCLAQNVVKYLKHWLNKSVDDVWLDAVTATKFEEALSGKQPWSLLILNMLEHNWYYSSLEYAVMHMIGSTVSTTGL
jgi:hypothetical protein